MPQICERLVDQLKAKGNVKNPYAVATSQLQKHGILKKGTQELTPKGEQRQAMGAAGRAKDRAAKHSGGSPSDYTYNPRTNVAHLSVGGTTNYVRSPGGFAEGGPPLPRSGVVSTKR